MLFFMSENEIRELKEQLKKELLAEIQKPKKESTWKKVKREYEGEFKKFDYIDRWEFLNFNHELIVKDTPIRAEYLMSNAIGTLARIVYKVKSVKDLDVDYEELKGFVDKILKVCKEA